MAIHHLKFAVIFLLFHWAAVAFGQNIITGVRIPSCDEESEMVWNQLGNIHFFDSNGYTIALPDNRSVTEMVIKARTNSLNATDRERLNQIMKDSVYDPRDYLTGYARILAGLPKIVAVVNQLDTTHWNWNFLTFPQYTVRLTLYGPGGSYNPENGEIILLTTPQGTFKGYNDPVNTIIHEIIHIGIESSLVGKYQLPHALKERIADLFVLAFFSGYVTSYKIQDFGDEKTKGIDKYLQSRDDFINLPSRVAEYLESLH